MTMPAAGRPGSVRRSADAASEPAHIVTADNSFMRASPTSPSLVFLVFVVASAAFALSACTPLGPAGPGARPRPVQEAVAVDEDIDDDGQLNNDDDDIDGDGIANTQDDDSDGDGVPNVSDDDVDGDGILDADDETPFGNATGATGAQGDLDGDGEPNATDNDDDGNGLADFVEGIGSCDGVTQAPGENADCDGYCTGVEGSYITCDDGAPPGSGRPDLDGDGVPDPGDLDSDGDGTPDLDETPGEGEGDTIPDEEPVPEPQCTTTTFDVSAETTIPPRILLVVDKSGSMEDPAVGFGGRKWDAARTALQEVVGQASAQFGLMLYPDGDANNDVCEPGALRANVGAQTSTIINTLGATEPGGGTPTATTLVEARDVLDALSADGGQRAVVLATDGGPNCNGSLDGNTCTCVTLDQADCQSLNLNCLDESNAVGAAAQVAAAGYPLFVIGIPGSENFTSVLDSMAQAGGTGQVFNATTANDLAQRIDAITQVLAGCRFTLDTPPPANSSVSVTVDGASVAADANNGFTIIGDALELHGNSCSTLQAGAQAGATVALEICEG